MMARHFDENETVNLCPFLKKLRLPIMIEAVEEMSNYVSSKYLSKYLRHLIQNNSKVRSPQKEERWTIKKMWIPVQIQVV